MDLETAVASAVAGRIQLGHAARSLEGPGGCCAFPTSSREAAVTANLIFCDLTHCQFLREPPPDDSAAAMAARETRGIVLTFEDKPFAPMFSRSCGGHTRTPAELGLPG